MKIITDYFSALILKQKLSESQAKSWLIFIVSLCFIKIFPQKVIFPSSPLSSKRAVLDTGEQIKKNKNDPALKESISFPPGGLVKFTDTSHTTQNVRSTRGEKRTKHSGKVRQPISSKRNTEALDALPQFQLHARLLGQLFGLTLRYLTNPFSSSYLELLLL